LRAAVAAFRERIGGASAGGRVHAPSLGLFRVRCPARSPLKRESKMLSLPFSLLGSTRTTFRYLTNATYSCYELATARPAVTKDEAGPGRAGGNIVAHLVFVCSRSRLLGRGRRTLQDSQRTSEKELSSCESSQSPDGGVGAASSAVFADNSSVPVPTKQGEVLPRDYGMQ
jgi:hypothetical protein